MNIEKRKEIVRKIADGEITHIPVHLQDLIIKYYEIFQELTSKNGNEPTIEEISNIMKLDIDKVKQLKEMCEKYLSL